MCDHQSRVCEIELGDCMGFEDNNHLQNAHHEVVSSGKLDMQASSTSAHGGSSLGRTSKHRRKLCRTTSACSCTLCSAGGTRGSTQDSVGHLGYG
jgi:hypothetical protein